MKLLNGPIEVGIRVVILLEKAFPTFLDLGRLVILNHCIVHSDLFGGPTGVHPNRTNSLGELGLKRGLIEDGLQIMRHAGLVHVRVTRMGIFYSASEDAAGFLKLIDAPLVRELEDRAEWVLNRFSNISNDEVQRAMLISLEELRNYTMSVEDENA